MQFMIPFLVQIQGKHIKITFGTPKAKQASPLQLPASPPPGRNLYQTLQKPHWN